MRSVLDNLRALWPRELVDELRYRWHNNERLRASVWATIIYAAGYARGRRP